MKSTQTGSTKTWILVAGFAVAGASLYLGNNYPFDSSELTGTIQPAERHQTAQIGASDVVLGDETISQFVQTDGFQMLVEHPEYVDVLTDARFTTLAADARLMGMMTKLSADERLAQLRQNQKFAQLASDARLQALMADQRFTYLMADARLMTRFAERGFQTRLQQRLMEARLPTGQRLPTAP